MEKVKVEVEIIKKMKIIKSLAIEYEQFFSFQRRLGITGELGEILICHLFGLDLVKSDINEGFDAVDLDNRRVQIKSVRKRPNKEDFRSNGGRLSKFSEHEFDYCYLILFDKNYFPTEIWKASMEDLKPIIEKHKRRNPTVSEFKHIAQSIDIPKDKIKIWKSNSL